MSPDDAVTAPPCAGGALLVLAALLFFCLAAPAFADTIAVETGIGFHHSPNSETLFLRYQRKAFVLFGFDTYYEGMAGAWTGRKRNEAVALSLGILLPWDEQNRFFGSAGLGLCHTSDNLGTPGEITFHVGYTRRFRSFDLSVGYVHFSNGKYFFGWNGPNYGENFLTAQVGWNF